MEFTLSEEALLVAALSSHEFKLKRQMNLFRKGLDDVLKDAAEHEINLTNSLRDKISKVGLDNELQV
jgi:hypothetical protein